MTDQGTWTNAAQWFVCLSLAMGFFSAVAIGLGGGPPGAPGLPGELEIRSSIRFFGTKIFPGIRPEGDDATTGLLLAYYRLSPAQPTMRSRRINKMVLV
jgi:hypothetical protein